MTAISEAQKPHNTRTATLSTSSHPTNQTRHLPTNHTPDPTRAEPATRQAYFSTHLAVPAPSQRENPTHRSVRNSAADGPAVWV